MNLIPILILIFIYFIFLIFAKTVKLSFKKIILVTIIYSIIILFFNMFLFNKIISLRANPTLYCKSQNITCDLNTLDKDKYFDIKDGKIVINKKIEDDKSKTEYIPYQLCSIKESNLKPQIVETSYVLKNNIYRFLLGEIIPHHYDINIPTISK